APRRIVRLAPGQTATFARPDAPVRIEPTGTSSWTAGLLAGRGMRLADVVAEANRHGDARLALAEPALGELRVSGGFRPGDSETLAASLAAALDLTVVPRGDGTLVLARTASGGRGACSNGACPAP